MVFRILTKTTADGHVVQVAPFWSCAFHGVVGDGSQPVELSLNFQGGSLDTDREFAGRVVTNPSHPECGEPLAPVVDAYLLKHEMCGLRFDTEAKVIGRQAKEMHMSEATTEVFKELGNLVEDEGFTLDEVLTHMRSMKSNGKPPAKQTAEQKKKEKELAHAQA